MQLRLFPALLMCLLLVSTACSATPSRPAATLQPADEEPAANPETTPVDAAEAEEETVEPTAEPAAGAPAASAEEPVAGSAMERPAWQQLPFTDARTGEIFTLADFADKIVFVEPMATWCTNCRQQLTNVRAARSQLNRDDVIFVALSVETNISDEQLAQYADNADFPWIFAVATPELLNELVANFGRTITNPPSTPHFIIHSDGSTSDLVTGIESPDQLIEQISASGG